MVIPILTIAIGGAVLIGSLLLGIEPPRKPVQPTDPGVVHVEQSYEQAP